MQSQNYHDLCKERSKIEGELLKADIMSAFQQTQGNFLRLNELKGMDCSNYAEGFSSI
jgi:hypothetical protein